MGRCYVMKRVSIVVVCCCTWASFTAPASALQFVIAQAAPVDATYIIRRGTIQIVPAQRATLENLLKQTVLANFEQKRLDEVLHELAEQTGVSIQFDSRAKDKQAMPVTA